MKLQSTFGNTFTLLLLLISFNGFSQAASNGTVPPSHKSKQTTLLNVVEGIKEKNKSIKNADCVNVMVDDLLIKDLQDFTIDPNSISMIEVLVLEPKANGERINPSIIINTK